MVVILDWPIPNPTHLNSADGGSMFFRNVGIRPQKQQGATIHSLKD
jgi:hypothetical protein